MNFLVGNTSLILRLIGAVQSVFASSMTCNSPAYCTYDTLFYAQFFQGANVTSSLNLQGFPLYPSILYWNYTFASFPELTFIQPNISNIINGTVAGDLFSIDAPDTLFEFSDIESALTNNITTMNNSFMGLSDSDLQFIGQYVNTLLSDVYFNNTPSSDLQNMKGASELTSLALLNLFGSMGEYLAYNLTAIWVYENLQNENYNCKQLLTPFNLNQNQVDAICNNPILTLDSIEGQATWVEAFLEGPGGWAYNIIQNQSILLTESTISTILEVNSTFGGMIQSVLGSYSQEVGCPGYYCNNINLAVAQWANASVISALSQQIIYLNNSQSIAQVFPEVFPCGAPEFAIVTGTNFSSTLTNNLTSYTTGSLLNKNEMFYFNLLYWNGEMETIQEHFNFDQNLADSVSQYISFLYSNYYNNCNFTQYVSVYDLLWGFNDSRIEQLQIGNPLEGAQPYNTIISLVGPKDNLETYSDELPNLINTGGNDINQLRMVTQYQGNSTVCVQTPFNDGNTNLTECVNPWNGNYQLINGTDGFGFSPIL